MRVAWQGDVDWTAEVCELELSPDGIVATGTQLGVDPYPYRASYELDARGGWITRRFRVTVAGGGEVDLRHDGEGRWAGHPELDGALDCDLAYSPLTNFMPARRLRAEPADHVMAWVSVPDLGVLRSDQRYEPIDARRVRYIGLEDGFTAELELDDDGLVVRYPRLAERVGAGARGAILGRG